MTGTINDTKRAWRLMLAGAGLALATAGCMTADPYGQEPYDQGTYGNQGDYDPYGSPGGDNYAAPLNGAPSVAPRRIRGDIATRDFPRNGAQQRDGRRAVYQMDVSADGRVTSCRVSETSGLSDLDAFMCRLITQRFVYEPARDASGRPVASVAGWQQSWDLPGR